MPYDVIKTTACPINRPFGVVKQGTATPLGCHASESDASDQVQALYTSEDIARAKYDGIDFKPSKGAQAEAEKGLEWRKEYNRGGTLVGVARARDIANGRDLSPETIGQWFKTSVDTKSIRRAKVGRLAKRDFLPQVGSLGRFGEAMPDDLGPTTSNDKWTIGTRWNE